MPDRSHLSIGEVLSLLRDEFPDVTISKIRFLESQGLVDPERTPSGYRKFYDHDVERLRWILRQQREHFLPLKVIRGRLSERSGDLAGGDDGDGYPEPRDADDRETEDRTADDRVRATSAGQAVPAQAVPAQAVPAAMPGGEVTAGGSARSTGRPGSRPAVPSLFASLHGDTAAGAPGGGSSAVPGAGSSQAAEATGSGSVPSGPGPAAEPAAGPAPARPAAAESSGSPSATAARNGHGRSPAPADAPAHGDHEPETYTAEELAAAAGAEVTLVAELKQYGLIGPQATVAGTAYYDDSALAVTRAAAGLGRHGVEVRHLRIWRNAADREADLFQQVVLPLLRQRNPQARRQAFEILAELSAAGADLRTALLERALRDIR